MPKLKTNKSAQGRFKITATGKVLATRAGRRHLLTSKSSAYKRKRRRRKTSGKIDARRVKRLLPYQ